MCKGHTGVSLSYRRVLQNIEIEFAGDYDDRKIQRSYLRKAVLTPSLKTRAHTSHCLSTTRSHAEDMVGAELSLNAVMYASARSASIDPVISLPYKDLGLAAAHTRLRTAST